MRRFRKARLTKNKQKLAHAHSLVVTHGPGSVPTKFILTETQGGARSLSGAGSAVQSSRDTEETCQVGDLIKYLNIFIQTSSKNAALNVNMGWLEWAVVCKREADADIPITQLGVSTLGVVANQMYRNECILTGNFPLGLDVPNSVPIIVKLPKTKQYLTLGDTYVLFVYYRTSSSTETATDSVKSVLSTIFNSYG